MVSKLSPFCLCPPLTVVKPLSFASVPVPHSAATVRWDLIARERMANNQAQAVFRREFALVVHRNTSGRAVVGGIFRNHRVQIMARHVPGGAHAKSILPPGILSLAIASGRIKAAAGKPDSSVKPRLRGPEVLTSMTPPIFPAKFRGNAAV